MALPKCPQTGKVRFRDEIAAKMALVDAVIANNRGNHKRAERRYYQCPSCHGWHLTSKIYR